MPVVLSGLLLGCGGTNRNAEVEATKNDLRRFAVKADEDSRRILEIVKDYVQNHETEIPILEAELDRYLWLRKAEFWRSQDAIARHIANNWHTIHQLQTDVARYYGYQLEHFPQAADDILNYLNHADDSWRNLTQDIMVFLEYHQKEFFVAADWAKTNLWDYAWQEEYPRLRLDLWSFIEWREREYNHLVDDAQRYFASNADLMHDLKADLRRKKRHEIEQARRIVVDLRGFYGRAKWELPRLEDDITRFLTVRVDPVPAIKRHMREVRKDSNKLVDEIVRYKEHQERNIEQMKRRLSDFVEWRDREGLPLLADTRRFLELQIERGRMTPQLLKRLFIDEMNLNAESMANLRMDWNAFVSYSSFEWANLKRSWGRFLDYDPAFGGSVGPMPGGGPMVRPNARVEFGGYQNIREEDFSEAVGSPQRSIDDVRDSAVDDSLGRGKTAHYRYPVMEP